MAEDIQNKIKTFISAVLLYLIINVYVLTGKNIDFDLGDNREKYFNNPEMNTNIETKQCKCGEEILNDFCTEEQLLQGCKDIVNELESKKKFLRRLVNNDLCNKYIAKIKDESNTKMSDIFDLKFDKINKMSLGLIIIIGISTGVCLFIILSALMIGCGCCGDNPSSFLKCILVFAVCYVILEALANIGVTITMIVYYTGGDLGDFADFLECDGINKNSFNLYSEATSVKPYFIAFTVINLICEVFTLFLFFCLSCFIKPNDMN